MEKYSEKVNRGFNIKKIENQSHQITMETANEVILNTKCLLETIDSKLSTIEELSYCIYRKIHKPCTNEIEQGIKAIERDLDSRILNQELCFIIERLSVIDDKLHETYIILDTHLGNIKLT